MVRQFIRKQLHKAGYDIVKTEKTSVWPEDFETLHQQVVSKVQPYTMTSPERIYGLIEAVKYITKHQISGDIVECGVWKGGSMLAVAETLLQIGDSTRKLFLYDTFEGMPPPTKDDVSYNDEAAQALLDQDADKASSNVWAYSTLETVQRTMSLSTYPSQNISYVRGKVEDTIPGTIPEQIALLRLDTDWYESTRHEMIHLFPRLVKGGVLIIDDYGFWKGARKAIDEYLEENNIQLLLNRLDFTGRIGVKL